MCAGALAFSTSSLGSDDQARRTAAPTSTAATPGGTSGSGVARDPLWSRLTESPRQDTRGAEHRTDDAAHEERR